MARARVNGDSRLTDRARRSLQAHKRYRSRAHSLGRHTGVVAKLEDAHDDLCITLKRVAPPLPALPGPPPSAPSRAAAAAVRAQYGPRSAAVWKLDQVRALGGAPVQTPDINEHLRALSDWYRSEVDRSVGKSRKAKQRVRRAADAMLTANLAGLHYLRLAGLNSVPQFEVLAAAGLQKP